MEIKRGYIVYADLSPARGSEQGGLRPCLVVSNNIGNHYAPIVMVAPITTQVKHRLPTHFTIGDNHMIKGTILFEQIKCIDKSRIKDIKDVFTDSEMKIMNKYIKIAFEIED